jgi:hypothetical protein
MGCGIAGRFGGVADIRASGILTLSPDGSSLRSSVGLLRIGLIGSVAGLSLMKSETGRPLASGSRIGFGRSIRRLIAPASFDLPISIRSGSLRGRAAPGGDLIEEQRQKLICELTLLGLLSRCRLRRVLLSLEETFY